MTSDSHSCLAESLPAFWWRDPETLAHELRAHGDATSAARAHGVGASTVKDARARFKLARPAKRIAQHLEHPPGSEVSREEKLEAEVKELRAIVRRDRDADVLDARILDLVREHVNPLRVKYAPAPLDRDKSRTPHTHLLQWSDLHACEVVDNDQMNGLNSYDWDTMLRRHETMRHAMLSFRDNRPYQVEELVVAGLGDMLTGDIHDELRVTNEKVLTEATFQLAHDMGDFFETLVPEYPRIRFRVTFGNHGRLTPKPSFKNAFHNWDWLFYKTLALRLQSYESIDFEVTKAAQVPIEIYNKRILLWHGDGVKSTMVDVPWGGIMRYAKKLSDTWRMMGRPIDHFAIGHWHEANQVRAGWILMNGSIKGQDEYAMARFGGGSPAQQVLAAFHPRRGLTETCLLNLQ